MNCLMQSSVCVSEVFACLVSIEVKEMCVSVTKFKGKNGRAFQISCNLWLSSGDVIQEYVNNPV